MNSVSRPELLGAWELSSYLVVDGAGHVIARPFGEDATGLLLYTADGYMSAQLMRSDRPPFDVTATSGGSVNQTVAAARGYLAYSGRFDVDEATDMVLHHVAVALLPNWIGADQIRHGTLRDGSLVLSGDVADEFGVGASTVLTWQRPY